MREPVAVVTMVKDDLFFLRRWVAYYGELFGREALFIFNHGGSAEVAEVAAGCNVMRVPPGYDAQFNVRRANALSQFAGVLLKFFDFVIVVDVDEFILVDPASGLDLKAFLARRKRGQVISPIGLEVIHRPAEEPEPIGESILQARRHVRYSSFYCKPCILGRPTKLSRGQHYATDDTLKTFRTLFLFHMKYCDREMSLDTMRRRAATIQAIRDASDDSDPVEILPTRWGKDAGQEEAKLEEMSAYPIQEGFDWSAELDRMNGSWGPRANGFFHFERCVGAEVRRVPDRFAGLI